MIYGREVENLKIICNFSDSGNITVDETFNVIGRDTSNKFNDNRYDDLLGSFVDGKVEFNLPAYKGQRYEFIYRCQIDENIDVGEEITTTAVLRIDGVDEPLEVHTITLNEKVYSAQIPVYGPVYTLQNEHIGYEFYIKNTGNQILENINSIETLPDEIDYYELQTGVFHISGINEELIANYNISYTTALGNLGTFGPFNTNVNSKVDLQFLLDSGDNLATLTWELPKLSVGVENRIPTKIDGIVKSTIPDNITIVNELNLNYEVDGEIKNVTNSKSTIVQNTCYLNTRFSQTLTNVPINPGKVIRYSIGATCRESRLNNPIIAFYLPKELEYIDGANISYNDYFKDKLTPKLPKAVIISNVDDDGGSFVKFEFKDENAFNFRQKSNFSINFDCKIKTGATGNFTTFMVLNTLDSIEFIPEDSDIYRDEKRIITNNPNVSDIYAKSIERSNQILFYVSTKSNKKVKGNLDSEYLEEPFVGSATEGGNIEYKISITNIGNVELEKIEIVDIMPHIGDNAVLFNNIPRESNYSVYAISEVTAKLIRLNEEEKAEFDIYYSNSFNPVRFGPSFNTIGIDDDWIKTMPINLLDLKSFKVVTKDLKIYPNDILEITVIATAPVGVPVSSVAWNSFAADAVYKDLEGNNTNMLAIEPEKVGIEVKDNPIGKGKITGMVWFDKNKNGIPDIDEEGINNILVTLINEEDEVVEFSITTLDFNNNKGYYSINNLEYGRYRVAVFIPKNYSFTIKNDIDINGSKVNSSGITDYFVIDENNDNLIINAGVINKSKTPINQLLKVNQSANASLKNVIRNQLLMSMKMEDTKSLIEKLD